MSNHAIVFILGYGTGIAATLFGGPFYGLLAYLFEYYNHPPINWWGEELPNLRYALTVSLILLGSFLMRWKLYRDRKIFDVPQTKWLILLFILMLVITPFSLTIETNNYYVLRYLKLIILYLLIYKIIRTVKEYDLFIYLHILGCFWLSLQAFLNPRRQGGKLYGIGTADARSDNHLAALLISSVPLVAYFIFYGKKWERLGAILMVPFILNGIILCNSRGASLGLIAGGLVWVLLVFKEKIQGLRLKTIGLLVAGGILFVLLVDASFLDRFSTLKDPSEKGSGKRIGIWRAGVEMMQDYPLGTGSGGFMLLSSKYVPDRLLYRKSGARAAHSLYMLVAVEQGLLGLTLFLAFLGSTIFGLHASRIRFKDHPEFRALQLRSIALESAIFCVAIANIFLDRLYSESNYWFFALAASLYMIAKTVPTSSVDKTICGEVTSSICYEQQGV